MFDVFVHMGWLEGDSKPGSGTKGSYGKPKNSSRRPLPSGAAA